MRIVLIPQNGMQQHYTKSTKKKKKKRRVKEAFQLTRDHRTISFLVLSPSSLYGSTIEFNTTTSEGTLTSLPAVNRAMTENDV